MSGSGWWRRETRIRQGTLLLLILGGGTWIAGLALGLVWLATVLFRHAVIWVAVAWLTTLAFGTLLSAAYRLNRWRRRRARLMRRRRSALARA